MTRANLLAGLGWISLSILSWAPMFSVAKRALAHLDPFTLGTARYLLGVVLLVGLLVAVEGRSALRFDGRLAAATLCGLIGITGFNLFLWIGLMLTAPEHAALILQLQSPLTALAVWLVHGQRPARFTLGCMAVAFAGVALVVTRGELPAGSLLGDLLAFLAALSWAIYTLVAARAFAGWSPLRFTVLTCIPGLGGLLVANAGAVALGWAVVPSAAALGAVGGQIVYFAVCTVVLGILGFNNAARRLGPLNAILMLNVVPVGVFALEAALGRSFTVLELGGAALVIGALVANNLYLRGLSTSRAAPSASSR